MTEACLPSMETTLCAGEEGRSGARKDESLRWLEKAPAGWVRARRSYEAGEESGIFAAGVDDHAVHCLGDGGCDLYGANADVQTEQGGCCVRHDAVGNPNLSQPGHHPEQALHHHLHCSGNDPSSVL